MPTLTDFTDAITHTAVYTLSDGSVFLVSRSATYGELMITTALMAVALVLVFTFVYDFARGNR